MDTCIGSLKFTEAGQVIKCVVCGEPECGVCVIAGVGAPRVVVLGGGFGGLYAAVRLDQLLWPRGSKPQVR